MEMFLRQNIAAFLLIVTIGTVTGQRFQEDNNDKLRGYLIDSMNNYTNWIIENKEDPSFPIPDPILLSKEFPNLLQCEIKRHVIRNHSRTTGNVILADGSFTRYYAAIGQAIVEPYEFTGQYNCTGIMYAKNHEDLHSDLPFQGAGEFVATVKASDELVDIVNLGVTEDHRFDISHAWNQYYFDANFSFGFAELKGEWNNTEILEYVDVVRAGFEVVYSSFLNNNWDKPYLNPSGVLLIRYGNEILRNANLTEIVGEENLPPPHVPTPPTTTTSRPTTSSTTTPSTTPSTTSTTPRNGVGSALVNNRISFAQLISVFLIVFPITKLQSGWHDVNI